MDAPKALDINDLSVTLGGKRILQNITFSIDVGDFLIIIGPNGSGKTTLIKAVLGLVPSSGKISIFGKPANRVGLKGMVGYVPQKFEFDRTFPITVSEVLDIALGKELREPFKRKQRIGSVLDQVGMADYAHKKIGTLSGGQIQRVLIARAIANQPKIVFFDEPLAGVDIKGEKSFYELIRNLKEAQKLTVALISHDVTVVNLYADKVAALNRIMVAFGSPKDVLITQNMEKAYGQGFGIFKHKECLEKPQEELTQQDIERCKLFGE